MKRIIAGVLAALAVLSVSAPAYAAAVKSVKKQGEITYEVVAQRPKIVLNVVLPSQIKAAMNPYGNDFQIDDLNTIHTKNGIVSVAYPVHNLDKDYGVFIDAIAVTSTSGRGWSVTTQALTPGVKGANMSLTASATEAGIAAAYSNVKKAATSATDQGNLPLDSTVIYDGSVTMVGRTSQQKFAYVPASADGVTPSKIYIGFSGALAEDSADTPVNWTESDYINVNLVLKLVPAPKTL